MDGYRKLVLIIPGTDPKIYEFGIIKTPHGLTKK